MLWLLFLLVACAAAVAAAREPEGAGAGRGALSLYEAAFLSGGPQRVGDLALVVMDRQRRLLLAHTGWVTVVDPDGRDELERSVISAIGPHGQSPVPAVRSALASAAPVRALADRLVTAGLAVPAAARTNVAAAVRHVRAAVGLVLLMGAAALLIVPPESGRGQAAAWFTLPLLLTLSCLAIARVEVHPYTRWASPAGQKLLGRIETPRPRPGRPARRADERGGGVAGGCGRDAADAEILTALALHGASALPDPALRAAFKAHWGH
ncbi:TIGR04222 domain-containing membrane protein [Streptomyces sp. ME19-01-6]|uniref:TIGR04222 domain-containing membrane protein n=1 Tax=Streptomyces sp. ME19-01-6 TaxID=3028686 RepID=UPI0029B5C056|nr:TIGR04222 domain-containing membrane protein [Streptomyces sp. ME19-01-6]MDX3231427.1 TIGR04222 domain-containing membrane protein [Streptomyces sp. ME19-01-6]